MTLRSRRKRPITAPITRPQETATNVVELPLAPLVRWTRSRLSVASVCLMALANNAGLAQDGWRPERLPTNHHARPLASGNDRAWLAAEPKAMTANAIAAHAAGASSTAAITTEDLGGGVGLRWKPSRSNAAAASAPSALDAFSQPASPQPQANPASVFRSPAAGQARTATSSRNVSKSRNSTPVATNRPANAQGNTNSRPTANPLRSQVRPAAYQPQDGGQAIDSFGDNAALQLPPADPFPQFPAPQALPALPEANSAQDPLAEPELPPPPVAQPSTDLHNRLPQDPSPFDRSLAELPAEQEQIPPEDDDEELDTLPGLQSPRRAGLEDCDTLRDRIGSFPITDIDLDVSPSYGVGLRTYDERRDESQRQAFVETLSDREWRDYRGRNLAFGRLLDLRDERVILDVGGVEQVIPIRDLSDLDVAYVGDAWNIPTRCGIGYEPFEGRNFAASTVQWTAASLCHKPLYFQQVQLERYGHELGPILQPIVSSAHFFGSIAVLPYKAGIHPPNECQYPLGYYRPGDCAPYMMQPIPWSLRGGLTQAAAVTGAAALIP